MTRFQLALEASHVNNIDVALQAAQALNEPGVWKQLGSEALRQGNVGVVEKASQQTLDFERLSFLYSVAGNQRNLGKMLNIATNKRHDANAQYYNALLLGDVEARVKVLEQSGQYQLAYLTARAHGLAEMADSIRDRLQAEHNRRREEQGLESGSISDFISSSMRSFAFGRSKVAEHFQCALVTLGVRKTRKSIL